MRQEDFCEQRLRGMKGQVEGEYLGKKGPESQDMVCLECLVLSTVAKTV